MEKVCDSRIKHKLVERKPIMDFFRNLPKDLRGKIQQYHKSELPKNRCVECRELFYSLSDVNSVEGYMCMPCVIWFEDEERQRVRTNAYVNGYHPHMLHNCTFHNL